MRIPGLDLLRAIAILMVLFRHGDKANLLQFSGWAGVDLFFVLSGYLVSGLLFKSYQNTGNIDLGTFLIRRGLKIYPSFYLFIAISITVKYLISHSFYPAHVIFSEVLFLQSYLDRMWTHTWSLAIEEHFYFLLSVFLYMMYKLKQLSNIKLICGLLLSVILISFILRTIYAYPHKNEPGFGIFYTHLRSDGIAVGVLIAYLSYFTDISSGFARYKFTFLVSGLILISPVFIFSGGSLIMNTFGISMMNFGFGAIMIAVINADLTIFTKVFKPLGLLIRFLCFIGLHSYSIYLWHLFVKAYLPDILPPGLNTQLMYITFSLLTGILFSLLIESPILRWRNRKFKSMMTA